MEGLHAISIMPQATVTSDNELAGFACSFDSAANVDTRLLSELGCGTSLYLINPNPKLNDAYFSSQLQTLQTCVPESSYKAFDISDSSLEWDFGLNYACGSVKVMKHSNITTNKIDYYILVRAGTPLPVITDFKYHAQSMRYCDLVQSKEYSRIMRVSELNRDRIAAETAQNLQVEVAGRTVRELKDERVANPCLSNPSCYFETGENGQTMYYNACTSTAQASAGVLCDCTGSHTERWFLGNPASRVTDGGGPWRNPVLNACPVATGLNSASEHKHMFAGVSIDERKTMRQRYVWEGCLPVTHLCTRGISKGCSQNFIAYMTNKDYTAWNMSWGFYDLEVLIAKTARLVKDEHLPFTDMLSMCSESVRTNYLCMLYVLMR